MGYASSAVLIILDLTDAIATPDLSLLQMDDANEMIVFVSKIVFTVCVVTASVFVDQDGRVLNVTRM